MRTLAGLLLLTPALALADASVDAPRDKLTLLSDGKGHFVGVVPGDIDKLYYGTSDTMFEVPVQGGGMSGSESQEMIFVDPRFGQPLERVVDMKDKKWKVTCGERVVELKPVEAAQAKTVATSAKFQPSPRKFKAYALARDPKGNYYYVDTGRTRETEKNFRLFVGPKGNLKLQKMTNVVSDSEGDIFSTKTGSLRLILGKSESSWVAGKKQQKLVIVPVEDNVQMIYNDLGIYTGERMGTPCDDL